MLVELFAPNDDTPVASGILAQGEATTLAGLALTFEREVRFTGLKVASDPGVPLVWLGCILLVGGFGIGLTFRHRRIWGRLEARSGGGAMISVAGLHKHDVAFDAEFTGLVSDIRQACNPSSQP
jgi:cytochrome c biogenesis protein